MQQRAALLSHAPGAHLSRCCSCSCSRSAAAPPARRSRRRAASCAPREPRACLGTLQACSGRQWRAVAATAGAWQLLTACQHGAQGVAPPHEHDLVARKRRAVVSADAARHRRRAPQVRCRRHTSRLHPPPLTLGCCSAAALSPDVRQLLLVEPPGRAAGAAAVSTEAQAAGALAAAKLLTRRSLAPPQGQLGAQ